MVPKPVQVMSFNLIYIEENVFGLKIMRKYFRWGNKEQVRWGTLLKKTSVKKLFIVQNIP